MGRARGKEAAATRTELDIAKSVIAKHLLFEAQVASDEEQQQLQFAKLEHERTEREQQIEEQREREQ